MLRVLEHLLNLVSERLLAGRWLGCSVSSFGCRFSRSSRLGRRYRHLDRRRAGLIRFDKFGQAFFRVVIEKLIKSRDYAHDSSSCLARLVHRETQVPRPAINYRFSFTPDVGKRRLCFFQGGLYVWLRIGRIPICLWYGIRLFLSGVVLLRGNVVPIVVNSSTVKEVS